MNNPVTAIRRLCALALTAFALFAPGLNAARAQAGAGGGPPGAEAMLAQVRAIAEAAAAEASRQTPGVRVEVEVGGFDPRLRLAACDQTEAFLPAGMRLWGSARIGLKCVQGPTRWQVFIPVRVKAWSQAVVTNTPLPTGHEIGPADVRLDEVDLAAEVGQAIADPTQAVGRVLLVPAKAGQTLRLSNLRPRQWFGPGDTVTLETQGPGFSITAEGVALNAGLDGQTVRVRTEGGKVVSGVASGPRRVLIKP